MWRCRHRKRLCIHQPAQHLETRVPVSDFAGGQQRRVGRATYAQQAKVGPTPMTAQPAYSDDRPATTEPRQECHRLRSTARKNDSRRSRRYRIRFDNREGGTSLNPPAAGHDAHVRRQPPLVLSHQGPGKEEPPFTDGRFDALASCHPEGLRVREGGVVGA